MSQPIKVLYFVDRMRRGGIQSLVVDWVSRFDKNKIHVDFLLLDDGEKYELEDTLKELGCDVYKLNKIWVKQPFDFIKEARALDKFFKEHHDYKALHLHSSSKNYMVLKYAKKYCIPVRIAHSHNIDFQTENFCKKIIGNLLKIKLIKYSTDYFACSEMAGKWLFGEKIVNSEKFRVIRNAIDYEKFRYDTGIRNRMRKQFSFTKDNIVIGHVGRFVNQKNHEFLINLFVKLVNINANYRLLLIGTGEREGKIRALVKINNISDKVIFAGFRTDVQQCMQAMDLFLMPSLYEGLGLVLIEAQASGLPCVATKGTIPEEAKILENFKFIDLDIDSWRDHIKNVDLLRANSKIKLKEAGYDINDSINILENYYLECDNHAGN